MSTDEAEALRALSDAHAASIRRYVIHLTGNASGADDIVQETLVRAWRTPKIMSQAPESTRSWLFTVARNLVIDTIRARRARPAEIGETVFGEDWAHTLVDSSGDAFERSIDSWQLAEVVMGLSPEHRAVLVETYYHGASVAQAAKTLGIPPGTVKSRTYYALRALRLACEERGITP